MCSNISTWSSWAVTLLLRWRTVSCYFAINTSMFISLLLSWQLVLVLMSMFFIYIPSCNKHRDILKTLCINVRHTMFAVVCCSLNIDWCVLFNCDVSFSLVRLGFRTSCFNRVMHSDPLSVVGSPPRTTGNHSWCGRQFHRVYFIKSSFKTSLVMLNRRKTTYSSLRNRQTQDALIPHKI